MAEMYKFPPTIGDIFRELDEDRKIKGNVTINNRKFSRFCEALENINNYGKSRGKEVRAIIDDPREPFETHVIMIDFETSEFNGKEVYQLSEILKPFDFADFSCDEEGNLSILLHMEGIYEES